MATQLPARVDGGSELPGCWVWSTSGDAGDASDVPDVFWGPQFLMLFTMAALNVAAGFPCIKSEPCVFSCVAGISA